MALQPSFQKALVIAGKYDAPHTIEVFRTYDYRRSRRCIPIYALCGSPQGRRGRNLMDS